MYAAHGNFTNGMSEYPDSSGTGEVVYDGFGNPVGFLPGLIRKVGGILRRTVPVPPGGLVPPIPGAPFRPLGPQFSPMRPLRQFPPPVGWVTPALPYTGRAPRRLYMRCSVWPGPAGLVPQGAMAPPPGMPGALPARRGWASRRRIRRRRR